MLEALVPAPGNVSAITAMVGEPSMCVGHKAKKCATCGNCTRCCVKALCPDAPRLPPSKPLKGAAKRSLEAVQAQAAAGDVATMSAFS